jgi:hypothetical protein
MYDAHDLPGLCVYCPQKYLNGVAKGRRYCRRTQKCRNFCLTYALLEGQEAWGSLLKKPQSWSIEAGSPTVSEAFCYRVVCTISTYTHRSHASPPGRRPSTFRALQRMKESDAACHPEQGKMGTRSEGTSPSRARGPNACPLHTALARWHAFWHAPLSSFCHVPRRCPMPVWGRQTVRRLSRRGAPCPRENHT